MAIPDTQNQDALYLAEHPDWQRGVVLGITGKTDVQTSHDGTEQRARLRAFPRLGLEYVVTGLTATQASVRRVRSTFEVTRRLIVPVWPWSELVTEASADAVVLAEDFEGKFWQVGEMVLVEQGNVQRFRTVTALNAGTKTLTFDGAEPELEFDPDGGLLASEDDELILSEPDEDFIDVGTSGKPLIIYPCISAVRVRGQAQFDSDGLTAEESVKVEQL